MLCCLPLDLGQGWLALVAYLGGFSAATAMVMVAAMARAATGTISFVAMAQFAPAVMGGLYWRRGNLAGALAGFVVWAYAMMVPVMARAGWLPRAFAQRRPLGPGLAATGELAGPVLA